VLDDQMDADVASLNLFAATFLQELAITATISDDCVHEMCRYAGAELHSMASLLGGMVGHEVIKLVTHQYVPFNNTFIYNGITCSSITIEL
jgi:amyloid beta precursor protein binding protein 1